MNASDTREAPQGQTPAEFTIFDLLLLLAQHTRRLILVPLLMGALAFAASFFIPPRFTASAQFMTPSQQQGSAAAMLGSLTGGLAGAVGGLGLKNPAEQWVGLLKSRTVADGLIQRFGLRDRYKTEFQFQTRGELASRTNISAGKDGLIDVEVEDTEPEIAAKLANAYIEELQKLANSLAIGEAAQRRVFFETQLKEANASLTKAEQALQRGGINENLFKTSPDAAVETVAALKAQVVAAEVKMSVMRGVVTESSNDWKQAKSELDSLRAQLSKVERGGTTGAAAAGHRAGDDYVQRYRDFKYSETLFELMARQLELAKADEAKEGSLIQVLDAALVPEWKSSPKRLIIALIVAVLTFAVLVVHLLVRTSLKEAARVQPGLAEKLTALRAFRPWR